MPKDGAGAWNVLATRMRPVSAPHCKQSQCSMLSMHGCTAAQLAQQVEEASGAPGRLERPCCMRAATSRSSAATRGRPYLQPALCQGLAFVSKSLTEHAGSAQRQALLPLQVNATTTWCMCGPDYMARGWQWAHQPVHLRSSSSSLHRSSRTGSLLHAASTVLAGSCAARTPHSSAGAEQCQLHWPSRAARIWCSSQA